MEHSAEVISVRAALERDPDVNLHRNAIEVSGDGVIELRGEVDDIVAKRRAFQIARAHAGGLPVKDALVLRRPGSRRGDELRQAVLDHLTREPEFRGFTIFAHDGREAPDTTNWISVEVEDVRVRLRGQVWSLSHRRLAEVLAWWVGGTGDVDNRLHVQPAERDSDAEITDAVRIVFDKDRSLDAQEIHITTRNGEVRLEGSVPNDDLRRIASHDCWYIPGVHAVHNNLRLRAHGH